MAAARPDPGRDWEVLFKCADGKATRDCRIVVEAGDRLDAEIQAEEAVRKRHEGSCIEETPSSILIYRQARKHRKAARPWLRYFGFTARRKPPGCPG